MYSWLGGEQVDRVVMCRWLGVHGVSLSKINVILIKVCTFISIYSLLLNVFD